VQTEILQRRIIPEERPQLGPSVVSPTIDVRLSVTARGGCEPVPSRYLQVGAPQPRTFHESSIAKRFVRLFFHEWFLSPLRMGVEPWLQV